MGNLDERKLRILQTIIDDYILTAAPVGSRTISKRTDISLSSATIRNEMSDLEEMGYLEQPHTSAGRIPSEKAYRLYVDSLMNHPSLTEAEIRRIRGHFDRRIQEAEEVISQTARVLSEITDYTSMVMAPQLRKVIVKHIQLVPVSEGRALAVIVTDSGIVRDAFIQVPLQTGADELERYSRMITQSVANRTITEATDILKRDFSSQMSDQRAFFSSIADAINQGIDKSAKRSIALGGTTNILKYPEYSDMNKARNVLAVLEAKETLYKMLSRSTLMEFTVTIGSENEIEDLLGASVVTATYKIGGSPVGSFGVIGPTRMNYSKVISVLACMGSSLSEVFTNMTEEEGLFHPPMTGGKDGYEKPD